MGPVNKEKMAADGGKGHVARGIHFQVVVVAVGFYSIGIVLTTVNDLSMGLYK